MKIDSVEPLTDSQLERVAYLAEECGEVVQACMKIIRHGYDSHNPDAPDLGDNRAQLGAELRDVFKAANLLEWAGDIVVPREDELPSGKYFHSQPDSLYKR